MAWFRFVFPQKECEHGSSCVYASVSTMRPPMQFFFLSTSARVQLRSAFASATVGFRKNSGAASDVLNNLGVFIWYKSILVSIIEKRRDVRVV